ncbi:MAG: alkaline phosphatase family protein [Conexivisphaerales archaeon]
MYKPSYDGKGLANLPSSIFRMLSCKPPNLAQLNRSILSPDEGHSTVLLFLLDGFGYNLFKRLTNTSHYIQNLASNFPPSSLTTVFPSTTSTVLTTLNTAVTPNVHGILGYTMYLKEFGFVANMLDFKIVNAQKDDVIFDKGISPERFLGLHTVHQMLTEQGISCYVITKNYILNSGLSRMIHAGARSVGYVDVGDMFIILRHLLEEKVHEDKYVFVYWPSVDSAAHAYGPWTEEVAAEARNFFYSMYEEFLRKISDSVKNNLAIIITADHGQIDVENGGIFDASKDQRFMDMLVIPPTGDSRASFLYTKKVHELEDYVARKFDNDYYSLASKEALRLGLFGNGLNRPKIEDRIGDILLLPGPNKVIFYPFKMERAYPNKGAHSGLTEDELLVPLFYIPCKEVKF